MKWLLIVCAIFLLIGIADLPIGYYTFLRVIVSIGSLVIVVSEFNGGINVWAIIFGIILILFNPIFPIYLNDKEAWKPIDIVAAIMFFVYLYRINRSKS